MKNSLYISFRSKQKQYIENNFNNVYFIKVNSSKLSLNKVINKVKKENIEEVIIENYFSNIIWFIRKLNNNKIPVKVVWTLGLATLNDPLELDRLLSIIDLLDNNKIKTLAFTEDNMYLAYKHHKGVRKIKMTVFGQVKSNLKKGKLIGLYGNPYLWQNNYFNQLSAVKLIKDATAVLIEKEKISLRFCKLFDINYIDIKNKLSMSVFNNTLKNIKVASCVYFTNENDLYIIDSFNHGVPVLLGNNTLFFKGTKLEKYLTVSSDDDISEIASKLSYLIENSKKVIEEYKVIKKEYDNLSKDLIKKFVNE